MDTPRVEVDEVIATEQLEHRPVRVRAPDAEARAMGELRHGLAGSPRTLLQKLSDVALYLCAAQSAGVSLFEEVGERRYCRWLAASGAYEPLLWTTLPCASSPCGTMLERQEPMLVIDPQRCYSGLGRLRPPVVEALLVPFQARDATVGSLWVVSHDPACRFDAEDLRIVQHLTRFAGEAYECLQKFGAEDVRHLSRMLHEPDLPPYDADPDKPL
jgi:hypothetical protein